MAGFRKVKSELREELRSADWKDAGKEYLEDRIQLLVGPLFSLLLAPEELVRWRAVTLLGKTVARLADYRMEAARIVMRRFMWHMNEESGNIGWGIPESMAESMARHARLADEYHKKLAPYIQCPDCIGDDNYMDHPPLRQATYWGLGRLAEVHPHLVQGAVPDMIAALSSEEDVVSKGLICYALGNAGAQDAEEALEGLVGREEKIRVFRHGEMIELELGELAADALEMLSAGQPA